MWCIFDWCKKWTGTSLVQAVACHLLEAKPLSNAWTIKTDRSSIVKYQKSIQCNLNPNRDKRLRENTYENLYQMLPTLSTGQYNWLEIYVDTGLSMYIAILCTKYRNCIHMAGSLVTFDTSFLIMTPWEKCACNESFVIVTCTRSAKGQFHLSDYMSRLRWVCRDRDGLLCTSSGIHGVHIPSGNINYPDSKVHGANMGPTWVLSAPDGPHVDPMICAIWVVLTIHLLIDTWQTEWFL